VDVILAIRKRLAVQVPAIIVTGDTSAEAANDAGLHGIPLILKPVDPAALRALIDEAAQAFARRSTSDTSVPA
jgi:DNA-binding NtrC family response regulator